MQPIRLLIALALCLAVAGAGADPVSHKVSVEGVDITLTLSNNSITVGEPVILSFVMENVSPDPLVDLSSSFQFPTGNGINLQVQPPGELPYRYGGAVEPGNYAAAPLSLITGRPVIVNMLLLYDRTQPNGYLFSKKGSYVLMPEFEFFLRKAPQSNKAAFPPITVVVADPAPQEAEAQKLLDGPGLVRALHLAVTPTTGILNTLMDVQKRYPETQTGKLSLRAAGMHLATSPDLAERPRGAAMLTQYLKQGALARDADSIALTLAQVWHVAGQEAVAREWIFFIVRNYPLSPRLIPEDPVVNYYYFAPREHTEEAPWFLMPESWKVPGATPPTDLTPRDKKE